MIHEARNARQACGQEADGLRLTAYGFRLGTPAQTGGADGRQPTADGLQLTAPDQADSVLLLRRRCGDAEDLVADGGKDFRLQAACLPLLQQHLGFFRQRRAGD
jgi:hypothetical protein